MALMGLMDGMMNASAAGSEGETMDNRDCLGAEK